MPSTQNKSVRFNLHKVKELSRNTVLIFTFKEVPEGTAKPSRVLGTDGLSIVSPLDLKAQVINFVANPQMCLPKKTADVSICRTNHLKDSVEESGSSLDEALLEVSQEQ